MNKKKIAVAVLVVVAISFSAIFLRGPSKPDATDPRNATAADEVHVDAPSAPPTAAPRVLSGPIDSGDLSIPDTGQIEADIEKDPQMTPESVLQFAHELSEPMEQALTSPDAAAKFFPRLVQCAKGATKEAPLSIRAICLANAQELSDRFPERLQSAQEQLISELPSDVVKLASGLN